MPIIFSDVSLIKNLIKLLNPMISRPFVERSCFLTTAFILRNISVYRPGFFLLACFVNFPYNDRPDFLLSDGEIVLTL